MRTAKAVSVEALHRLWSELALLRQEVKQAERAQSTKLVLSTGDGASGAIAVNPCVADHGLKR
jgi:hypothetical protein